VVLVLGFVSMDDVETKNQGNYKDSTKALPQKSKPKCTQKNSLNLQKLRLKRFQKQLTYI
jgi:hypothetical protein